SGCRPCAALPPSCSDAASVRPELALGAVRAVERERRRLIEFRVIAPVSTPSPPLRITQSAAFLAAGEDRELMTPAARVHPFHTGSIAPRAAAGAGLFGRLD